MKYVLYARKSTEEDDRQVLSIQAQLAELSSYSAKEKFDIVASFYEATTAKEPGEKHRREPFSAKSPIRIQPEIAVRASRLALRGGERTLAYSSMVRAKGFEPLTFAV